MSVNFGPIPLQRDPRAADPMGIADIKVTPVDPTPNSRLKVEITRVFGGPTVFEVDAFWAYQLIARVNAAGVEMARRF